jgi:hypothetical protein
MKSSFFSLLLLFSCSLFSQADFKVALNGRAVEIKEIDNLTIVGYEGAELKISRNDDGKNEVDERAIGMRKISASGKQDNTGFGLASQALDGKIVIEQVGNGSGMITISIPNNARVKVVQSTYKGGDLNLSNFKGELDVSMHYHEVKMTNCYGPLSINAIYGNIEATFTSGAPTKGIQLHSSYADIDVTLPAATKADLLLSTSYGSMYTDFDLDVKAGTAISAKSGGGDGGLSATLNGGGELISLTATHKNIYLRKQ